MSISYHPTDDLAVYVEDPGYGYLAVEVRRDDEPDGGWRTLEGAAIGAALRAVTALALDDVEDWRLVDVPGIGPLSRAEARILARPLAEAAVYAAAGSERAERVLDESDRGNADPFPTGPLCATCNEGSPYATGPAAAAVAHCAEYGHSVYGVDPEHAPRWEDASARAEREQAAYWQRHPAHAAAAEEAAAVVQLDSRRK